VRESLCITAPQRTSEFWGYSGKTTYRRLNQVKQAFAQMSLRDWLQTTVMIIGFIAVLAAQAVKHQVTEARSLRNEEAIGEMKLQVLGNSSNIATVSRTLESVETSLRQLVTIQQQHNVNAAAYIEMIKDNREEIDHLRQREENDRNGPVQR